MKFKRLEITNRSVDEESTEDVLSIDGEVILIYTWIVFSVICQTINLFGIGTNIINIICFAKQGFKDSVNISLIGLSLSDLGCLMTLAWICITVTPAVVEADVAFISAEVTYLTAAMPHLIFTRISSCITALITLERCLCITTPLKIKSIITPSRVAVITVCVFIIFFCITVPVYIVNKLGVKVSPVNNKTIFCILFTKDKEQVEKVYFTVLSFPIPFAAFAIIVICTAILSLKLRDTSKWRQNAVNSTKVDRVSYRNQNVAKMVVMISTLYIICFFPFSIITLAVALVPDLSIQGKYVHIGILICGIAYAIEGINSSMNIFIYYHMSSKYRQNLYSIICRITNFK